MRIEWKCGDVEMPMDFSKFIIFRYNYVINYIDGKSFGTISNIGKLDKIDKDGYKIGCLIDFKRLLESQSIDTLTINRNDLEGRPSSSQATINFDMTSNFYWSYINLDLSYTENSEKQNELKVKIDDLTNELNKLKEEYNSVKISNESINEITPVLKEKFIKLVSDVKKSSQNISGFKFEFDDVNFHFK